ncbi:C-type lectin mosGCTL-7-like [Haematobia irritans]|uniref:C-type lectin mosGCTL-7-like n=1 Tax=Haematobia irritans TaxID=7368 RepID=UPI003F5069E1
MTLIWKALLLYGIIALTNGKAWADDADDDDVEVRDNNFTLTPRAELTAILGKKQYYIGDFQKRSWYEANIDCIQRGMTLTSIESSKENDYLSEYIFRRSLMDKEFWTSGSNLAGNGFLWFAAANTLDYSNWANGMPQNVASRCIKTTNGFKWTEADCTTQNYYICSRPLIPNCGPRGSCRFSYPF